MTLTMQWTTIALMVGSGFLVGIILDIYRVLKERLRLKGWVVSLIDLLYWVVCAGLVFSVLFWSNWGDFRFYIFVAIVVGLGSYLYWFSSKVTYAIKLLIQGIEKLAHVAYRAAYYTIWVPGMYLWTALKKIWDVLVRVLFSLVSIVLRPFMWVFKPVQRVVVSKVKKHVSWMQSIKNWWKNNTEDD